MADPNLTIAAAQIGADAIVRAAWIGDHATSLVAWATILAACAAFFGAYAVFRSSQNDSSDREKSKRDEALSFRKGLASAFCAEIESLQDFLTKNDVIGTLKKSAESGQVWHFHPGQSWLKLYDHNPSSVGEFEKEIPYKIASYYCRMSNELGRLIWLHEMTPIKRAELAPASLNLELLNSSNTLVDLFRTGNELVGLLRSYVASSPTKIVWGTEVRV